MYSSRKYPYLPRGRDFCLGPSAPPLPPPPRPCKHPSGNSNWASYISFTFLVFQTLPCPTPQEIPGGDVGIFWICRMVHVHAIFDIINKLWIIILIFNLFNLSFSDLCFQLALPHIRKTKGNIINMSSLVAQIGQPGAVSYVATKVNLDFYFHLHLVNHLINVQTCFTIPIVCRAE